MDQSKGFASKDHAHKFCKLKQFILRIETISWIAASSISFSHAPIWIYDGRKGSPYLS